MTGAGNTDACLRPRRVPGPGKPSRRFVNFVFVRLRMPGAGNTGACLRHDVSPGLANPPRRVVNNISFPAHHYFDTTAPMLTRRPLTPAAPRRLPRHRPPGLDIDHGILCTATSTTAPPPTLSATSTNGTKGYRLLEQPRWFPLQPRLRDASTVMTVGGVSVGLPSDSSPVSPSASLPL